jgi:hypothetical protein
MTLEYRGVSVSDLEGEHPFVRELSSQALLELWERQRNRRAAGGLNPIALDWLEQDIELVEEELERRWEAGRE